MIPDESVAYALAAWNRFDQSVPDGLLRAVSGAFVLVAAADGELSRSEAVRFFEVLRSKADAFSAIDFRELEKILETSPTPCSPTPRMGNVSRSSVSLASREFPSTPSS